MSIEVNRHGDLRAYWIRWGRLTIRITNAVRMFEERKLPSIGGWWVQIKWRRA